MAQAHPLDDRSGLRSPAILICESQFLESPGSRPPLLLGNVLYPLPRTALPLLFSWLTPLALGLCLRGTSFPGFTAPAAPPPGEVSAVPSI